MITRIFADGIPMVAVVDPVMLEVVKNRLLSILKQMSAVVEATAYSTIFSEGKDFTCTIFDADMRLAVMTPEKYGCRYMSRLCLFR
jgi:N-methylhydantoinase B/oxoprolinase/acetone carboxylase alpha subunit